MVCLCVREEKENGERGVYSELDPKEGEAIFVWYS